jgi:hypothetical protein
MVINRSFSIVPLDVYIIADLEGGHTPIMAGTWAKHFRATLRLTGMRLAPMLAAHG